jgi:hypothetical protein
MIVMPDNCWINPLFTDRQNPAPGGGPLGGEAPGWGGGLLGGLPGKALCSLSGICLPLSAACNL